MIPVNRREITRYLGYGNQPLDAQTQAVIEESIRVLQEIARPKSTMQAFSLNVQADGAITIANTHITSRGLAYNLRGCERVVLMAATLGVEVDRCIARETAKSMARAVVFQAVAAELIEGYCNQINDAVSQEYACQGLYTRPRFSPGYGDFSIVHQLDFARLLQTPKKIGLTVTDSMMLVPIKSVTAVIGLSASPRGGVETTNKCKRCDMADCSFRENETK